MTTERDPRTRIVLSWLREDTHENAERVLLRSLDEVDATPQRRSWWPARRNLHMNKFALTAAAAATVLGFAVVGYSLLPGLGIIGPGAAPPSPPLLARGNFVTYRDWGAVEIEASGAGSNVTGRMTMSRDDAAFTLDLQCARTTEDGLIVIGGYVTDTAGAGVELWPEGTLAAIALKRGSPVQAQIFVGGLINLPATWSTGCLPYIDAWITFNRNFPDDHIWLDPIEGTVELGP